MQCVRSAHQSAIDTHVCFLGKKLTPSTHTQAQAEMAGAMGFEVERLDSMIAYKKQLVDSNIRCPITGEVRRCRHLAPPHEFFAIFGQPSTKPLSWRICKVLPQFRSISPSAGRACRSCGVVSHFKSSIRDQFFHCVDLIFRCIFPSFC